LFSCVAERGVYEILPTAGKSAEEVLALVEKLEAAAPTINANVGGGIGGNSFKLADIV